MIVFVLLFQQFKWQVKEAQTLRGPYNKAAAAGSPRGSANGADDAGDYEVVQSDAAVDQEYEMPQPAYTKSVLAKFRNLEDSQLPPPSPERSESIKVTTRQSSARYPDEREQPDGDEYEDVHREPAEETEEELPEEGTTRNLLAKFQAMQA